MAKNKTNYKELEIIIGRMVHVGVIMTQIHHFMSRLRDLLRRVSNRRSIKLTDPTRKDLELVLLFFRNSKILN